jgi:hypothetical protein
MGRIASAGQKEAFRQAVEAREVGETAAKFYIPATVRYELPLEDGAQAPALSEALPVRPWAVLRVGCHVRGCSHGILESWIPSGGA